MVMSLDKHIKHGAVTKSVLLEAESAVNIYRMLKNVYGKVLLDVSTVKR